MEKRWMAVSNRSRNFDCNGGGEEHAKHAADGRAATSSTKDIVHRHAKMAPNCRARRELSACVAL